MAVHEQLSHVPMCLLAAVGLLVPRLILVLMWLFNSAFVHELFEVFGVPNSVIPITGFFFFPIITLGFC